MLWDGSVNTTASWTLMWKIILYQYVSRSINQPINFYLELYKNQKEPKVLHKSRRAQTLSNE